MGEISFVAAVGHSVSGQRLRINPACCSAGSESVPPGGIGLCFTRGLPEGGSFTCQAGGSERGDTSWEQVLGRLRDTARIDNGDTVACNGANAAFGHGSQRKTGRSGSPGEGQGIRHGGLGTNRSLRPDYSAMPRSPGSWRSPNSFCGPCGRPC